MSIWKVALIVLTLPAALSNAAFAQRGTLVGNPLPAQAMLNRFKLQRAWWGQVNLNVSRDKVLYLTLDDDRLYVQASSGAITAFDSESGKRLWATQLGKVDDTAFPATTNLEHLLVISGVTLYAINKDTGDVIWKYGLGRPASTTPTADEENIYVGCIDGSVIALNLKAIKNQYDKRVTPGKYTPTLRWKYSTGKLIRIPPLVNGNHVYFASTNGSLYDVTCEKRKLVFQFETNKPISAPLATYQDSLLAASEDLRFYALNLDNGGVNWQTVTGLTLRKAPQVIHEDLFLTPQDGGLLCLAAKDGSQRWSFPRIQQFVAASPAVVYASDPQNNLVLLSRDNGSFLGSIPLHHFKLALANDRTDRMYLSTATGLVVALHERNITEPKAYKYPERQPILPEFASEEPDQESAVQAPKKGDPDAEELPAGEGDQEAPNEQ